MVISISLSSYAFFNRFNILDAELKKMSKSLAEACVETALLKLAQNKTYGGNENITVGDKQCSILAIESASGQKIVKTTATVKNFTTNLKITANEADISIVSWQEVANF